MAYRWRSCAAGIKSPATKSTPAAACTWPSLRGFRIRRAAIGAGRRRTRPHRQRARMERLRRILHQSPVVRLPRRNMPRKSPRASELFARATKNRQRSSLHTCQLSVFERKLLLHGFGSRSIAGAARRFKPVQRKSAGGKRDGRSIQDVCNERWQRRAG